MLNSSAATMEHGSHSAYQQTSTLTPSTRRLIQYSIIHQYPLIPTPVIMLLQCMSLSSTAQDRKCRFVVTEPMLLSVIIYLFPDSQL